MFFLQITGLKMIAENQSNCTYRLNQVASESVRVQLAQERVVSLTPAPVAGSVRGRLHNFRSVIGRVTVV